MKCCASPLRSQPYDPKIRLLDEIVGVDDASFFEKAFNRLQHYSTTSNFVSRISRGRPSPQSLQQGHLA
jgi:hypothetical protein